MSRTRVEIGPPRPQTMPECCTKTGLCEGAGSCRKLLLAHRGQASLFGLAPVEDFLHAIFTAREETQPKRWRLLSAWRAVENESARRRVTVAGGVSAWLGLRGGVGTPTTCVGVRAPHDVAAFGCQHGPGGAYHGRSRFALQADLVRHRQLCDAGFSVHAGARACVLRRRQGKGAGASTCVWPSRPGCACV